MASPVTFPMGPGQSPDNLTGLPAGQCKSLGQIGTGSLLFDLVIAPMTIKSGTGAAGTFDIYLAVSEATTNWTDGISTSATTDQSGSLKMMRKVMSVPIEAGGTVYHSDGWSVASVLGFMPMYACVFVYNNTGAALDITSSNFAAQYSTQVYQTPAVILYA